MDSTARDHLVHSRPLECQHPQECLRSPHSRRHLEEFTWKARVIDEVIILYRNYQGLGEFEEEVASHFEQFIAVVRRSCTPEGKSKKLQAMVSVLIARVILYRIAYLDNLESASDVSFCNRGTEHQVP